MCRARSRLEQDGLEVWKVADGMHQPRRISAVLCEASRNVSSKRGHIFAEQGIASNTVEAGKTGLHRISYNTVADGNVLDIPADVSDGTCCFVSWIAQLRGRMI
jgi:hypothetical protein